MAGTCSGEVKGYDGPVIPAPELVRFVPAGSAGRSQGRWRPC